MAAETFRRRRYSGLLNVSTISRRRSNYFLISKQSSSIFVKQCGGIDYNKTRLRFAGLRR